MTATPHRHGDHFPVVGVGAPIDGLESVCALLAGVPPGEGMAFVVLFDPAPAGDLDVASRLAAATPMSVVEARHRQRLAPGTVYVAPPRRQLTVDGDEIRFELRPDGPDAVGAVDTLFSSIARSQKERAMGVFFSGHGANGLLGGREIEAAGGIVIAAQDEESTLDPAVTRLRAASFVLPPDAIGQALVEYVHHLDGPTAARADSDVSSESSLVRDVDAVLRDGIGHDLSSYREPTLFRRILRRIGLRGVRAAEYLEILRRDPEEQRALLHDMMIGVSGFFRDPEAWAALETNVIAPLVRDKQPGSPIRVWVAGAATGEEAYSVAILLVKQIERLGVERPLRILATDVNEEALELARHGRYPEGVVAPLPSGMLRRFFTRADGGRAFCVRPDLRNSIVFSRHDFLSDPPFSRLDLVCCRNVLIYLKRDVQRHVVDLFRSVLRPGGHLFLGRAEAIAADGFEPVSSKKSRLFRATGEAGRPATFPIVSRRRGRRESTPLSPRMAPPTDAVWRAVAERFGPAHAVVSRRGTILHLGGRFHEYLRVAPGAKHQDLVAAAVPEIRRELEYALGEATRDPAGASAREAVFMRDGLVRRLRITVRPLSPAHRDALLVAFEEPPPEPSAIGAEPRDAQLVETQGRLLRSVARLEEANRELRISNEELTSTLEQLRAMNDAFAAVNVELQAKVRELESTGVDVTNLLGSSEVAILCVDSTLRLRWYTPATDRVVRLLPADVGETISGFDERLGGGVTRDARAVLRRGAPVEREVQLRNGRWWLRRASPYRGKRGAVTGVVLTLVDIDRQKQAEDRLRNANEHLERLVAERTWSLKLLQDVTAIANEAATLPEALRRALATIALRLGWPLAHAFVRRPESGEEFVDSGIWYGDRDPTFAGFVRATAGIRIRSGEGFPGAAVASGGPLSVVDLAEAPDGSRWAGTGLRGAAAVPVLVGSEVVGVIEMYTTERIRLDGAVLENLGQIGVQLGRVVERTRAAEALRHVSSELLVVEDRERKKIASDLHDDLGQLLTLARIRIDDLRHSTGADREERLREIRSLVDRANEATRSLMAQMSPPILHELGFAPALGWLAEQMQKLYGLEIRIHDDGDPKIVNDETALVLFRCTRELLVNVARHSTVKRAIVRLRRRGDRLAITVMDRGVGFDPAARAGKRGSFGLVSVRERLLHVGGHLRILSAPGRGTTAVIDGPLEAPAKEARLP